MWNEQEQKQQLGTPVIVQGTVVPNNAPVQPVYGHVEPNQYNPMQMEAGKTDYDKGEVQPKSFQDVGFAIFFIIHLIAVIGFMIIVPFITNEEEEYNDMDTTGILFITGISAAFSAVLSTLMLSVMMKFAKQLVKIALVFSIIVSGIAAVIGLLTGQAMVLLFGLLSVAIGICYAYAVWSRIPFAAANLNTSLTAVKANLGLALIAYFETFLAVIWTIRWIISSNVAVTYFGEASMVFLFLSFFWTHQVLQNTMHVTTAGVVGTWWFNPLEASSFCSTAIRDSFLRASTYSFGSICFGSLLVAIVQTLRQINHHARNQDDCQIIACVIDCILGCIQGIIEYLNQWAYVYVGIYGYSYLEAGRNVMTLFKNKGWDVIIADNLVENVLFMVSLMIGLITGIVGLIVSAMDQNLLGSLGYENVELGGFIIGFVVGYVMGSILMSVVSSAVNTVIVCFAESPNEFQNNHPHLSNEMRLAWRSAWPNECGYL